MSLINECFCNACGRKAKLKYNGEHWLPPTGWTRMWDDNLAQTIDVHTCDKCRLKLYRKVPDSLSKSAKETK